MECPRQTRPLFEDGTKLKKKHSVIKQPLSGKTISPIGIAAFINTSHSFLKTSLFFKSFLSLAWRYPLITAQNPFWRISKTIKVFKKWLQNQRGRAEIDKLNLLQLFLDSTSTFFCNWNLKPWQNKRNRMFVLRNGHKMIRGFFNCQLLCFSR